MNILKKIKKWWDECDIEGVQEFKRYELKVTFVDGEVKTYTSSKYYNIICSYAKYISIDLKNGIELDGRIFPQHMIRSMEDKVIDTQLVIPTSNMAYGVWGITKEEIEQNQIDYESVIEKYRRLKTI